METSVDRSVTFVPPPQAVHDLAEGCRAFVKKALGVELDYQPETLSVLDHYVEQARGATAIRPEAMHVLAHSIGAYFGEVVRRQHPSWWQTEGSDPIYWQVQFEEVYLAFSPVALVYDALTRNDSPAAGQRSPRIEEEGAEMSQLELEDEDKAAVAERLAELPAARPSEFYAPSTRLEVIDIAVEAIRARKMGQGEIDALLTPEDYEGFPLPS